MLIIAEKGIRGGIWHGIPWYAKANKNTWNIRIKTKNHHKVLQHKYFVWMGNVLKLPLGGFYIGWKYISTY